MDNNKIAQLATVAIMLGMAMGGAMVFFMFISGPAYQYGTEVINKIDKCQFTTPRNMHCEYEIVTKEVVTDRDHPSLR